MQPPVFAYRTSERQCTSAATSFFIVCRLLRTTTVRPSRASIARSSALATAACGQNSGRLQTCAR
jgi:hypothetical protein